MRPRGVHVVTLVAGLGAACTTSADTVDVAERHVAFGRLAGSGEVLVGEAIRGSDDELRLVLSNWPPLSRYMMATLDDRLPMEVDGDDAQALRLNKHAPDAVFLCAGVLDTRSTSATTVHRGSMHCQPSDAVLSVQLARIYDGPAKGRGDVVDGDIRLCIAFSATPEEFAEWCRGTFGDEVGDEALLWPEDD